MSTRSYRYKIYPNKTQKKLLVDFLFTACRLYNHALNYRRKKYTESRHAVWYPEQNKMLTKWRNEDRENNPLSLLPSSAAQRVLRRLDKAYREFLKGKRGYPRFKASRRWRSIEFTYGNGASMKGRHVRILNVGMIKAKLYRPIPDGKIKTLMILRKPSGWYVILSIDILNEPIKLGSDKPAIGIDIGLRHALALSDGQLYDAPKFLRSTQKKLRREQRTLSRKKKGGNNRRKQVQRVARLHERIEGQRKLYWHTVTKQLINSFGLIAIEDLRLDFMTRNKYTAKAAHDIGLGIFRQLLDYKAIDAGVDVVAVNAHNTSQECSGCGVLVPKERGEHEHHCPECGLVLDRDVNAARNILLRAQYRPVGPNVSHQAMRAPRTYVSEGVSCVS